MKKVKILVLLVTLAVATFYSCTDNNPIENEVVAQKSIAQRTAMNELKKANDIADRNSNATSSNPFCFEFVYPITLSYNTGTTVSVSSLDGLLTILANENPNLYIDGISFPFQVTTNGAVSTISTEGQYISLLMSCGYSTINTDLLNSLCFDIVFPITVVNANNENVTITSLEAFSAYVNTPVGGNQVQIVYPISVIYNSQTIVIDNLYELYQIINNCDDCICYLIYDPVCVQTPTGVVEFGNSCFAECAGFTVNDFIDCDTTNPCAITNLTATPGACNTNASGMFPLTINFSHNNALGSTFEVRNESNALIGTYPLSSLPLTIEFYSSLSNGSIVKVSLGSTCSEQVQFNVPDCNNCGCPAIFDPVCVQTNTGTMQFNSACVAICSGYSAASFITCPSNSNFGTQLGTCFTIAYPVQIQYQGALVTVNSNSELLQYYFPAQSSIPAFVYPITATFGNLTVTVTSQSGFQSFIDANCN